MLQVDHDAIRVFYRAEGILNGQGRFQSQSRIFRCGPDTGGSNGYGLGHGSACKGRICIWQERQCRKKSAQCRLGGEGIAATGHFHDHEPEESDDNFNFSMHSLPASVPGRISTTRCAPEILKTRVRSATGNNSPTLSGHSTKQIDSALKYSRKPASSHSEG